jgi:hypothetical protein
MKRVSKYAEKGGAHQYPGLREISTLTRLGHNVDRLEATRKARLGIRPALPDAGQDWPRWEYGQTYTLPNTPDIDWERPEYQAFFGRPHTEDVI